MPHRLSTEAQRALRHGAPHFLAAICALLVSLSEAQLFFVQGARWLHAFVSFLALILGSALIYSSLYEFGILKPRQVAAGSARESLGVFFFFWVMNFLVFLAFAGIAVIVSPLITYLHIGSLPELPQFFAFARELGRASVFVSFVPTIVMVVAVKLGFKPNGNA